MMMTNLTQKGNLSFIFLCFIMRIINNSTQIIYLDSSLPTSGNGQSPSLAFNSLEEVLSSTTGDIDALIISITKPYHVYNDHIFYSKVKISYYGPDKATIMMNCSSISWQFLSTLKLKNILIKGANENLQIAKTFIIFSSILESSDYEIEVLIYLFYNKL